MNTEKHSIKVAAVQMVSSADVSANLEKTYQLLSQAAAEEADLVLLPENFAVFNSGALYDWSQQNQQIVDALQAAAVAFDLCIVAGSVPLNNRFPDTNQAVTGGRVRSACLVFSPHQPLQRYDKIHLFDAEVADAQGSYRESNYIEPGNKAVVAEVAGLAAEPIKLGLSICYDLRFPELYRHLQTLGAEILLVPAAFTWKTGKAHWEPLLRARAIENQCYVVAANQGGQHSPNRQTWGHSMIIDPWGNIMAQAEMGEAVVCVTLDLQRLRELRQSMPVLQHQVNFL